MPAPIRYDGASLDLSPRFVSTETVAASPAAGAITAVANTAALGDVASLTGVQLFGWLAFTVGTNGITALVQIRRTGVAGTVIAASGALTVVAATLVTFSIQGLDETPTLPGQVYSLCLTVGSGSAASTVSACQLCALVV